MRCLRSSRSVMRVLYILSLSLEVFPTHFSQLDLNSANLEATIQAEWFWLIFLLAKTHFQWRHNYVIITYCHASINRTYYNFSVTRNVRMIRAKNCEKLPKFVKVTAKILWVPCFSRHGVYVLGFLRLMMLYLLLISPEDNWPNFAWRRMPTENTNPYITVHQPLFFWLTR